MFVGDEIVLAVGFSAARDRLATLVRGDVLESTSEAAYDAGIIGLMRVGPTGLTRLVRVQARELTATDEAVALAIRWEATGPGGGLFPVLDADIKLTPAGEQSTLLTLAGVYRPPLGALGTTLDRTILHRVAAATIRNFISQMASAISGQPGPAAAGAGPAPLPGARGTP